MPDFDANEDPLRLSGFGRDDLPKVCPLFVVRTRCLASTSCRAQRARRARKVRPDLLVRRRNAARRTCGERVYVLATPPRLRRRLWTSCHGRPPGSPS